MFAIEMLPAQHGDCLWIEYGAADAPHRVLVDGGTAQTWKTLKKKLKALPAGARHVELLVITHIDADHIGGALELLEDAALGVTFGDVWFNGWRHLPPEEGARGAVQAEAVSATLARRRLPWNAAFGGGPVVVPGAGALPRATLPGGMRLTLLSPTHQELRALRAAWARELAAAGLTPGAPPPEKPARRGSRSKAMAVPPDVAALVAQPFDQDDAAANGSSIALLAEWEGRRALLTGDAYPTVLMDSLERYFAETGTDTLALDALKLPHHGSRNNVCWQFLYRVQCARYLVSTDGSRFHHPDAAALARIVTAGGVRPTLCFNYRTDETTPWGDARLRERYEYDARYPDDDAEGLRVEL